MLRQVSPAASPRRSGARAEAPRVQHRRPVHGPSTSAVSAAHSTPATRPGARAFLPALPPLPAPAAGAVNYFADAQRSLVARVSRQRSTGAPPRRPASRAGQGPHPGPRRRSPPLPPTPSSSRRRSLGRASRPAGDVQGRGEGHAGGYRRRPVDTNEMDSRPEDRAEPRRKLNL